MITTLLELDERVFQFLHQWAAVLPGIWKWLAILGVYSIPIVLVWYFLARRRETAIFAFFCGVFAWFGLNNILAAIFSRERPMSIIDLNFPDREFLFDQPGPSFPSDHAALMAAVTLAFFFSGERRLGWVLAGLTATTTLARIVTAQHWPGDILVGLFAGAIAVLLLSLIRRSLDRFLIGPLAKIARKIGL